MRICGINEDEIYIVAGYCGDVLQTHLTGTKIHVIQNTEYETTNMVCSLMCASNVMAKADDVLISYGDIMYNTDVLRRILSVEAESGVIVDDGWYGYWSRRNENPLDDAETLRFDQDDNLLEIGQKTDDISRIQSQYIGLLRFRGMGLKSLISTAKEADRRSRAGESLWRTTRTYQKMYMTDLLQGMIDGGYELKAVHIDRGWYEVDDPEDLKLAEKYLV